MEYNTSTNRRLFQYQLTGMRSKRLLEELRHYITDIASVPSVVHAEIPDLADFFVQKNEILIKVAMITNILLTRTEGHTVSGPPERQLRAKAIRLQLTTWIAKIASPDVIHAPVSVTKERIAKREANAAKEAVVDLLQRLQGHSFFDSTTQDYYDVILPDELAYFFKFHSQDYGYRDLIVELFLAENPVYKV